MNPPPSLSHRRILLVTGTAALSLAFGLAAHEAAVASRQTWSPFVLVAGLLAVGAVAEADGVFASAGAGLGRLPGGEGCLNVASMGLVAATTAVLNLDTAVAFLTPVVVHAARQRRMREDRLLYGCVFMANAASLLLPGSNLTNLLVLAGRRVSGGTFADRMAAPWVLAAASTGLVVALVPSRWAGGRDGAPLPPPGEARAAPPRPGVLGVAGIAVAALLVLTLRTPALPVAATGALLLASRLVRARITVSRARDAVDPATLAGVFGVAVALGALARGWAGPARLMHRVGSVQSAAIGAAAAVAVNNLPAAVLLGSRSPAHPQALLFGLNLGPNLAVTGSLSAVIWWQAARAAGALPSARRYSAVGVVATPVGLTVALIAAHFMR